jgi:YbdK family carboxylate-amine ligase
VSILFNPSERTSLGVEWELELIDLDTRHLRSGASEILAEIVDPDDPNPKAKHELLESTIEVVTGICQTVAEAKADLVDTVRLVQKSAGDRNLGVMCSGTHPFTDWASQDITPNTRYAKLVSELQWLARRLQIFGVHVHVGVRSSEKIIPIVNALLGYLPHILALSASSPYWKGHDTGLASTRSKIFEQLPTAGLPYQMSGWSHFESYMQTLIESRTIETIREVWWDVRPHPDFGTVEFRICDGLPTLDEVAAQAALSQCLVERLDRELDKGYTLPAPQGWVVRENKWRAARHGLDAEIIVDDKGTVVPLRRAIEDLVDELMPVARRLDCERELAGVATVLDRGASYHRQRSVAAAHHGDLVAVVDSLLDEMRMGLTG